MLRPHKHIVPTAFCFYLSLCESSQFSCRSLNLGPNANRLSLKNTFWCRILQLNTRLSPAASVCDVWPGSKWFKSHKSFSSLSPVVESVRSVPPGAAQKLLDDGFDYISVSSRAALRQNAVTHIGSAPGAELFLFSTSAIMGLVKPQQFNLKTRGFHWIEMRYSLWAGR